MDRGSQQQPIAYSRNWTRTQFWPNTNVRHFGDRLRFKPKYGIPVQLGNAGRFSWKHFSCHLYPSFVPPSTCKMPAMRSRDQKCPMQRYFCCLTLVPPSLGPSLIFLPVTPLPLLLENSQPPEVENINCAPKKDCPN